MPVAIRGTQFLYGATVADTGRIRGTQFLYGETVADNGCD